VSARTDGADASGVERDGGVWLHAVVSARQPLPDIIGVGGQRVRAIRSGDLTAVVSPVPLREYGEQALRGNLEDLDWLERIARAHHLVIEALSRSGPVVPARLATVYRGKARVASVLEERHDDFAAALNRVTGRTEWGVKAYAAPVVATASEKPSGGGGAGTAYLRRRRAQVMARDESQQAATRDAALIHAALSDQAVSSRRHAPQDRRLSGVNSVMVLNGAYLVDTSRTDEFKYLVDDLSRRYPAIRLQLTGPWPPYSFSGAESWTAESAR
jgi:hypothetical protein